MMWKSKVFVVMVSVVFIAACGDDGGGNNGEASNGNDKTLSGGEVDVVLDVQQEDETSTDIVKFSESDEKKIQFCYADEGCVMPEFTRMRGSNDDTVIRSSESDKEVVGVIVEGTISSEDDENLEALIEVVEGGDDVIRSEGPFGHDDEVSFEVGETE